MKSVGGAGYATVTMVGSTSANTLGGTQGHWSTPQLHNAYAPSSVHTYLDTPATTSAIQYRLEAYGHDNGNYVWGINRGINSSNNEGAGVATTTILTAMEIAV